MDASKKRQFHYHSDANPVGGHVTHPFETIISTTSSSSLPQAGGHVTAQMESYRLDPIVSVERAYSHISGVVNKTTGNWTTLTTSVVEDLNVLEVVTAERVVSRIALEYPLVGYVPKIAFVGVHFYDLRIHGHPVEAKMDLDMIPSDPDGKFPDKPHMEDEKFLEKAIAHSRRISGTKDVPAWLKERHSWVESEEERKKRGHVLCSLVEGVQGVKYGKDFGHVITVPDFGNIFLGELSVKHHAYALTMIRIEMGCIAEGNLSFATAASNGVGSP